MRKLMNKKGFSLVELMIVVVIMGILVAVAIPLYGGIQRNANRRTCETNIKTIKSNAANYMAQYNTPVDKAKLEATFESKGIPTCPLSTDTATVNYLIKIDGTTGAATVQCPKSGEGDGNHGVVVKGSDTVAAADNINK